MQGGGAMTNPRLLSELQREGSRKDVHDLSDTNNTLTTPGFRSILLDPRMIPIILLQSVAGTNWSAVRLHLYFFPLKFVDRSVSDRYFFVPDFLSSKMNIVKL